MGKYELAAPPGVCHRQQSDHDDDNAGGRPCEDIL